MSLQTILEIFISLIFAWLVLSIGAMYIQEWLGARLRWRSNMLEAHIRNMLADPALAGQFYDHPLIQSLHTGDDLENMRQPSYIPPRMFALALFDIVINAGKRPSIIQQEVYKLRSTMDKLKKDEKARAEAQFRLVLAAARQALNTKTGETALENAMSNVKKELETLGKINPVLQEAVQETLGQVEITAQDVDDILAGIEATRRQAAEEAGLEGEFSTLDQLRDGIAALGATNPQLKQTLDSLLLGMEEYGIRGENTLALARESVEKWFDDSTERLSGWYKRHAQKVSLILGISLAVVLNADTLALTQTLWREPIVRQAMVAQAEAFSQQSQDELRPMSAVEISTLQVQFRTLNVPIGWVGSPLPADKSGGVPMMDGSLKKCTLWPQSTIDYYGLKVGRQCYPIINAPALNDPAGILLKLFGLLVSGIAAALGAPFWFDILKKAVNIRTSGTNPTEAKG
jgi:hypothetical protein